MKKIAEALFLSTLIISPASAACNLQQIEQALESPLDGRSKKEIEATDQRSTEGGVWRIYHAKNGSLATLVRIDGGESGMGETRLSVVNPTTYGIAVTRVDYINNPFAGDGSPTGKYRRSTTYYHFCNGQLYIPPTDNSTIEDLTAYKTEGQKIQKLMLTDKDIDAVTKAIKR